MSGVRSTNVTASMEWLTRVDAPCQAVEFLGKCLNEFNSKFTTLEKFTLEENDNIHKDLDGQKAAEVEVKEAFTSLECQVMALEGRFIDMLEAMNAIVKALEESLRKGGMLHRPWKGRPGLRLPSHLSLKAPGTRKRWRFSYST